MPRELPAPRPRPAQPSTHYVLGCGDVLLITFASHPHWDCLVSLSIDGSAPIGWPRDPMLADTTLSEAVERVTAHAPEAVESVSIQLIETRAGHIYLSGPENDQQRVVDYHGPETVIDFLVRAGALRPGCANLKNVQVVRPNVAVGMQAVEYEVDVEAIVHHHDPTTNVLLQPSDLVYVGEMWRSRMGRLLPDWFRPTYRILVGIMS